MKKYSLERLTKLVTDFRDERNWKQFHNPKDVSLSMVLEASELMEHFQWKNEKEVIEYIKGHTNEISHEIADVFYWVLLLSHDLNIDIAKALEDKIQMNMKKYPVEKSYGKHIKYNKI
ncbi:MAG: nucleotide pyrophosphohydrolase [Ignavibacteria bacterium]